jgi:hypothetical protein
MPTLPYLNYCSFAIIVVLKSRNDSYFQLPYILIVPRGFISLFPRMCTMYFDQVHPLYFLNLLPSSPFQTVFSRFHYDSFIYMYAYFHPAHHPVLSPFPLSPSRDPPRQLYLYVHITIIVLGLGSA